MELQSNNRRIGPIPLGQFVQNRSSVSELPPEHFDQILPKVMSSIATTLNRPLARPLRHGCIVILAVARTPLLSADRTSFDIAFVLVRLADGGSWAMGWKFHDHFEEWFGGHRIWALSRIKWQGVNAFDNIWLAQTKEQEPIRFPDDDAVVVLNTHPKLLKLHPCPKSVNEMRFMVRHLSQRGQIVLDPFCGLGSTLVAAESLGRKWIGCDLSKRYCQVAMKRLAEQGAKKHAL